MTPSHGEDAPGPVRARVRMVARPSSVPAVRRFVDQALVGWGRDDLVDDVALSATELATNATLHSGSPYFEVELSAVGGTVRVGVVDGGTAPAERIADRGDAAVSAGVGDASMGGRGLFIVSALAAGWGVEDLGPGTRVWAEFGPEATGERPRRPERAGASPPAYDAEVRVIELRGCPPELLLAHDTHLADIARELRLVGASHHDVALVDAAEQVVAVVRSSAPAWDAARLAAQEGLREGLSVIDVAIAVADPPSVPGKLAVLRRAMVAAESMMARGLLMTLPAPPAVQEWRDWVESEMVAQVTRGHDPLTLAQWRSVRAADRR